MAGYERLPVTISAAGKSYTLHLTIDALCRMEEALSTAEKLVTFQQVLGNAARGSLRAMRQVFWAALLHHQPAMTIDEAGALIEEIGLLELAQQLKHVTASTNPDPDDRAELRVHDRPRKAQRRRRGAGGNSISAPERLA